MKLNKEQRSAVVNKDKNHLVVASAGSGKTKVLTSRVIHLLDKDEDNILLLTFTVKAAEEMITRIKHGLDNKNLLFRVTSGTFHSFSNKILRKYASLLGYDNDFTILDAKDSNDLMGIIAKGAGCKLGARTICDIYSTNINTGLPFKEVIKRKLVDVSAKDVKAIIKVIEQYSKYKKKFSIMDFDDLLVNMAKLVSLDNKILRKDLTCYSHILVDEFQDTNQLQIDIIQGLLNSKTKVFAVGDKNQNIYAFRGANPQHIIDFPKTFNSSYTVLQQNYRSSQQILNVANKIAEKFKDDFNITMFSTLEGRIPRYMKCYSEEEQCQLICNEIFADIKTKKVNPKDIAILYRSNSTADLFEKELRELRIPYSRRGGQSIFEMKHIKDILSLLRLSTFKMDTISWLRALQSLPKVGPVTANEALTDIAKKGKDGLLVYKGSKHWDSMNTLYKAVTAISKRKKRPLEALQVAIDFWYPTHKTEVLEKTQSYDESITSIKKIVSSYSTVRKCLIDLALGPKEEDEEANGIVLSTGHSAKGLEWKNVYLANITEEKMPSRYFVIDKKSNKEDKIKIEEELRLFYVMITRAKERLTICSPFYEEEAEHWRNNGHIPDNIRCSDSRFIRKILKDDKIIKVIKPKTVEPQNAGSKLLSIIRRNRK